MPSANVLRGARVEGAPVSPRGRPSLRGGPPEPLVHTAGELQAAAAAAHAAGLAEGEARGRALEAERLRETAALLEGLAGALAGERLRARLELRRETVRLALAVARRLTRRALAIDEEAAARALADALRGAGENDALIARLHPDDAARLESGGGAGSPLFAGRRLELRADESLERGGCVVETQALRFDATVEGHLERLTAALEEWCDEEALASGEDAEAADAA